MASSSTLGQKRKRKPGKRCVVMFCDKTNEDGVSLHQFPKDGNLCKKWNKFVLTKRDGKAWTPGTGHVCSDHFLKTDYEGYGAKLAGFSSKLVLKKELFRRYSQIQPPSNCRRPVNYLLVRHHPVHRRIPKVHRELQERGMLSLNFALTG